MSLRGDGRIAVAGLGRGLGKVNAYQFGRYLPSGELDPSFGSGGLTTVWFAPSGSPVDMDEAPDGRLVATGDSGMGNVASVARVTEDGQPDGSFHATTPAGVRFVDVPGSDSEEGLAVDVLGDGTVLIGGYASTGAFLAELSASGEPVTGFGSGGTAVFDLGTDSSPSGEIVDLTVLADGRIVATGSSSAPGSFDQLAFVARFTPGGQLDPSFAAGGVFRVNPTPGIDEAEALEVQPEGRILAAGMRGESAPENEDGEAWLFRLTADGQLDTGFGTGGEAVANPAPGSDELLALALQPDRRAVVAGSSGDGGSKLLAGRFTGDGQQVAVVDRAATPRCRGRAATIVGTNRNDVLGGTQHADVIVALGGNDKVHSRNGNDIVCGGPGAEVIKAGRGRDTVLGQSGRDILTGGIGNDLLLGGNGGDRLYGGAGRDRLFAGAGNDRLVGSKGKKDLCNGGAGPRDRVRGGCELLKKVP